MVGSNREGGESETAGELEREGKTLPLFPPLFSLFEDGYLVDAEGTGEGENLLALTLGGLKVLKTFPPAIFSPAKSSLDSAFAFPC